MRLTSTGNCAPRRVRYDVPARLEATLDIRAATVAYGDSRELQPLQLLFSASLPHIYPPTRPTSCAATSHDVVALLHFFATEPAATACCTA